MPAVAQQVRRPAAMKDIAAEMVSPSEVTRDEPAAGRVSTTATVPACGGGYSVQWLVHSGSQGWQCRFRTCGGGCPRHLRNRTLAVCRWRLTTARLGGSSPPLRSWPV